MAKRFSYWLLTIILLLASVSLTKAQVSNPNGINDPSETGTLLKPLKPPKPKKQPKLRSAEEYLMRGAGFFDRQDYDLAIQDYTEALKKKKDYPQALLEGSYFFK
jgi:Tfp pilus assembly protein PilF